VGLAQYLSLEPDGAWAELVRYEGIRTESERLQAQLRRRLWKCFVVARDIADLGTFDEIRRVGLDPEMFIDDDHAACQFLAQELEANGFGGLLTPSAAIADIQNLTIFGSRREIMRHAMRGPNRDPSVFVPVSLVADDAAPPSHVVDIARLLGDPHLGFLDWQAGP
jgi:RES domain